MREKMSRKIIEKNEVINNYCINKIYFCGLLCSNINNDNKVQ